MSTAKRPRTRGFGDLVAVLAVGLVIAVAGCGGPQAQTVSEQVPSGDAKVAVKAQACDGGDGQACYWTATWLVTDRRGGPEQRVLAVQLCDRACDTGVAAACKLHTELMKPAMTAARRQERMERARRWRRGRR